MRRAEYSRVGLPLVPILILAILVVVSQVILAFPQEASAAGAPTFNVKDYGAVGNGTHDDTNAIQAAINAVDPAVGGTVYVPNGVYLVRYNAQGGNTSLKLKSNMTFEMDPAAEIKLAANSSAYYQILEVSISQDVTITGGTITGDRNTHTGTTGEWGFGISLWNGKNITMNGVKVRDCWGDGIYVNGLNGTTTQNVTIQNCTGDNNRRQGLSIIDLNGGTVTGCTFMNTGGTSPEGGIDLEPYDPAQTVTNVTISGNTLRNNDSGIVTGGAEGSVNQITITGNTIESNRQYGMWIDSAAGYTISGNIIQANGRYGIKLMGCTGFNVNGNQVLNNRDSGIGLAAGYNTSTVSTNNTIQYNTVTGNAGNGIELTGGSTYNSVSGNNIWGNGGQPIYTDGTPNNTIAGNSFDPNNPVNPPGPPVVPQVSGISPTSGNVGATVTITGTGFGSPQGTSYVSFGSVKATSYTSWSDTQVACKVPSGVSGSINVTLTTGGGTSNSKSFTVVPPPVVPQVSGISPTSGNVGATVTVTGTGFGSPQGTSYVSFGSVKATSYTSWSDTQVACKVPSGVSGSINVTLTTGGGTSNSKSFTVVPPPVVPQVSGISPTSGNVGATVTVTGTGFGSPQGTSYVSFGSVKATDYTSWSDTQVACKVPSGVSGSINVTLTTDGGTSNSKSFTVVPPPVVPQVSGISPTSGNVGATVTVTGTGFGSPQGTSYVSFGSVKATDYTSWSDTQVACKVPSGVSGSINVTLTTGGGTSNSKSFTVVPPPVVPQVSGISPTSGNVGATVTVTGTGFGSPQGTSYVSFGSVKATSYTSWSDTQVACKVPSGVSGSVNVTLTTDGGTSNSKSFTVVPPPVVPQVSGISPTSGNVGATVTVTGTGFGSPQGTSYVSFGSVKATDYTSWSDTQVACKVPSGVSGSINVTLTTGGGTSNSKSFTVVPPPVVPQVSGISPTSGNVGATVTVTGTGFGSPQGTSYVSFGSVKATSYTSWSDTQVACKVPSGVSGSVNVTLTTDGGTSNSKSFTVVPPPVVPQVSGISPTSGNVGATVTVTGTGFGSPQGTSYVSFGSVKATSYTSWSDTQVACKVPSGVSGSINVTLTTDGGTSNSKSFTVVPPPVVPQVSGISPTSGNVGATVTVTGTGFGSPQGTSYVSFGSVKATDYTSWSDTQVACKVPSGVSGKVGVTASTASGTSASKSFKVVPRIFRISPTWGKTGTRVTVTGTGFGSFWGNGKGDSGNESPSVIFNGAHVSNCPQWSDTEITAVVPQGATTGPVVIVVDGTESNADNTLMVAHGSSFYFAEGYTGENFAEYLCIGNPNNTEATALVTYISSDGTTRDASYNIPANSRHTVNVNSEVGSNKEVSIRVLSETANLVAERPMYFNYNGAWTGGSDVVGATSPAKKWYFAEGNTQEGFDQYVTVLNPGGTITNLTFHYMVEGVGEVPVSAQVNPNTRATFKTRDQIGPGKNAGLFLESDQDVVVERPMYFDYQGLASNTWTGGHVVMGATSPAKKWYFAEGTTRSGFEEWLCLENPGSEPITVDATYQLGPNQGDPIQKSYTVPARQRLTISVNKELGPDKDVSVKLTSSADFIAERPMYFDYQEVWDGGHDVLGATTPATTWFFAEGYTGDNFNEWLCLQNPGNDVAKVTITYYPTSGTPISKPHTVSPNSRLTVNVNDDAASNLEISARVSSDEPIVAERPMYFAYQGVWTGGHDVVGFVPSP